jgi:hypothetical protein
VESPAGCVSGSTKILTKCSLVLVVPSGHHKGVRCLLDFVRPERGREINPGARTLGHLWCSLMHAIKWPIHGHYRCAICGRVYPVPWEKLPHLDALAGTAVTAERGSDQIRPTISFETETSKAA